MGRIDVHFHIIPQFFREAAAAAGRRPALSAGLPAWTPELAQAWGAAYTLLSDYMIGEAYSRSVAAE